MHILSNIVKEASTLLKSPLNRSESQEKTKTVTFHASIMQWVEEVLKFHDLFCIISTAIYLTIAIYSLCFHYASAESCGRNDSMSMCATIFT